MKKILILLLLLMLTACQSSYELSINKDLSFEESFKASGNSNPFKTQDELESYLSENYIYDEVKNKYNINTTLTNNEFKISGFYRGLNLKELRDSNYLNILYRYSSIKNNQIRFWNYYNETLPTEAGEDALPGFEDIDISIQLPFKILKHNAKRLDKSTNTLYYEVRGNRFPDEIYIKYDERRLYNQKYFIDIFDYVNIDQFIIIIFTIIAFILGIFIYFKMRKKPKQYHIKY